MSEKHHYLIIILTIIQKKKSSSIAPLLGNKYISLDDKIILIHIWDTCGMERFGPIVDIFYKDAKGAFVVYDITDRQSFNSVGKWIDKLSDLKPIITILGNKCDLIYRKISKDEGNKIAAKYKANFFWNIMYKQNKSRSSFE